MLTTNQTFPYTEESLSIDFSPRETAANVVAYLALNGVLPTVVTPGGAAVSNPDEYEGDMLIKWNVPQNDADGNPITQVVDGVTVPLIYIITTPWFKKDAAQIDLTIPVGCVLETLDWLEPELQAIPIRWITNKGQKYFPVTHIDAVIDANGNKLSSVIEWCREEVEDYGARMKSMEKKLLETAVNYGILSTPTGTTETTGVGYLASTLLTLYIDDELHIAADAANPDRKVTLVKEDGSVIGIYSLPLDYTLTEDNAFYIYSDTPVNDSINYSTTTMVVRAGGGSNISFVESNNILTISDNDNMKTYQVAKANTFVKADGTTIKATTSADGISKTLSVADDLQGAIYNKTTGALAQKTTSTATTNAATGSQSTVLGAANQALNASETALGQYNVSHNDGDTDAKTIFYADGDHTALSVGIGLSETNRLNAVEITQNGQVYIKGIGGYDGKSLTTPGLQSLQQVLGGSASIACYGPFTDLDDAIDTLGPADQDLLKAGVHFTVTQADGTIKEYIALKDNATTAEVLEIGASVLSAIADDYDPTKTYDEGSLILKDGTLYKNTTPVTAAEPFDATKWEATTVAKELEEFSIEVDDSLSDTSENPVQNKVIAAELQAIYDACVHTVTGNVDLGAPVGGAYTSDPITVPAGYTLVIDSNFAVTINDPDDAGFVSPAFNKRITYTADTARDIVVYGDKDDSVDVCSATYTICRQFATGEEVGEMQNKIKALETSECSADDVSISKSPSNVYSVAPQGITTDKIASAAVTADKLASNSVTTAAVSNGAITTAKLAESSVTSAKIAANAVETAKIKDGAVTEDKLSGSSVTEAKLANGSVTTGKIAADAIITNKIADSAVTTAKIKDDAITADKIADDAVETDAIKDGAITEDKLSDDIKDIIANAGKADGTTLIKDSATNTMSVKDSGITTTKIADGAITSTKIAASAVVTDSVGDAAITTAKIADNAVTADKLADDSVDTAAIKDANVTAAKLADDAKVGSVVVTEEATGIKLDIKDAAGTVIATDSIGKATDALAGVVLVDNAMSATSENPVQNKVVDAVIKALKLIEVGGADKVITAVAQADGLVTASAQDAVVKETTPTTGSAYTYTIANSTTKVELPLATATDFGEVKIDEEIKENASGKVTSLNTPTSKALAEYLAEKLGDLAGAMTYQGVIDSTHTLPATYVQGATYVAAEDGTYAGYELNIGHMLIANGDSDKGGTWTAVKPTPKVDNKDVTLSAGTKTTIATVEGKDITLTPQAIDSALSDTSENAVQNKVIKAAIDDLQDALDALDLPTEGGTDKVITTLTQEDGLVSATSVAAVTKETTPTMGSLATYTIAGSSVKVDIPFDTVIVDAEYKTCTAADTPKAGLAVGEIYLDLTVNDKDKTQTATHIYATTGNFAPIDVSATVFGSTPALPTGYTTAVLAQRDLFVLDGGAKYPVHVDVASNTYWYSKFDGATSQLSVVSSTI